MDAARRSSAFIALDKAVVIRDLTRTPGRNWASIPCASKKAYGCGRSGQKLIEGVTLYVRRLNHLDLSSSLRIGLSDNALRSIEAELGAPKGYVEVEGTVQIAHHHLLILLVVFHRRLHGKLIYYLVFDSTDSSIYMIPYIPPDLDAPYTLAPVPVRLGAGQNHALALMARDHVPLHFHQDRLCLFSPADPSFDNTYPWKIQEHRLPNLPGTFSADAVFSLGGKMFWADLSDGLLYSDLRPLGSVGEAHGIKLPVGVYKGPESAATKRTIGCVEGSITFVCISSIGEIGDEIGISRMGRIGDEIVRTWTLDLECLLWREKKDLCCPWKVLSKNIGFMNLAQRDVVPQFPVLMLDGALCLLLRNMNQPRAVDEEENYICSFDMGTKTPLWYGRVKGYSITGPVILPYKHFSNFFPSPPSKRVLPASKRELPVCERSCQSSRAKV